MRTSSNTIGRISGNSGHGWEKFESSGTAATRNSNQKPTGAAYVPGRKEPYLPLRKDMTEIWGVSVNS
jgi:hypothetical protein